jgi:RNA polymerase sigma-70 factor (ECF subfamily)
LPSFDSHDEPALHSSRPPSDFQRDLIALIPNLRAFSRMLCGRRAIAEDLAQEALAKAWRAHHRFEPGTNLKAWLFTILRNEFYTQARRARRESEWDVVKGERIAAPADQQGWTLALSDTAHALRRLPDGQREALILVGAGGFTYDDAAKICGTPAGTVKSRVTRGRAALSKMLAGEIPLPRCATVRMHGASNDILAQLSALARPAAHRAAIHA